MRPDVAPAFDRMAAAARAAGISLTIVSGYRSDAEQAKLYAQHPDPKWVAPPGQSLHRLGTELDLGPPGAWGWLDGQRGALRLPPALLVGAVALRLHAQPGLALGRLRGGGRRAALDAARVRPRPLRCRRSRARRSGGAWARRCWPPSSTRSRTSIRSRSAAPARRASRSSCPAPRRSTACATRSTPARRSTPRPTSCTTCCAASARSPLALAAYNAGEGAVAACGCVPPYPETRGYVARILALLRGAGDTAGLDSGLAVRLVK